MTGPLLEPSSYDTIDTDVEMYERQLITLMQERHIDMTEAQRLLEGRRPLAEVIASDGRNRRRRKEKYNG
jgi:hypothetical protein